MGEESPDFKKAMSRARSKGKHGFTYRGYWFSTWLEGETREEWYAALEAA